jgi:hypothetical protein
VDIDHGIAALHVADDAARRLGPNVLYEFTTERGGPLNRGGAFTSQREIVEATLELDDGSRVGEASFVGQ